MITHGHARDGNHTPTYNSWRAMLQRCTGGESRPDYSKYGGCGVKVCDHWLSFSAFLADMGKRPAGTTLDRYPNRAGNYEPGNCRWATVEEQRVNTKNRRYLTLNGTRMLLSEWATKAGLEYGTLLRRLVRGWTPERALTEPCREKHRRKLRTIICRVCGERPFHSFPKHAQQKKTDMCSKCRYQHSKKYQLAHYKGSDRRNDRLFAKG